MTAARAFSARWWIGAVCLFLALGTMGSGFLAAICSFAVLAGRAALRRDRTSIAAELPTLFVCAAASGLGWWLKTTPPLTFQWPQPATPAAAAVAFLRSLAWPLPRPVWPAFVLWIPAALVASTLLKDRSSRDDEKLVFLFTASCWVVLQAGAIALYRGGYREPASRYLDILAIGVLCNLCSLIVLLERSRSRQPIRMLAACWGIVVAIGLVRVTRNDFAVDLPERRRVERIQELDLRSFVLNRDVSIFEGRDITSRPYPDPARLAGYLKDDALRNVLPPAVRIPDPVNVEESSGFALDAVPPGIAVESDRPAWGSYTESGERNRGTFRSRPFPAPGFPYLRFEVSGDPAAPGNSLAVVTEDGKVHDVRPHGSARAGWRTGDVPVPRRGHLRIVATDDAPSAWFAFRAPCAAGPLTHLAGLVVSTGPVLLVLGLICAVFALATRETR
jgi:hypothetical protein